ncbi:hypothetical protein [Ferrimicrobium sp.]|uniref:hypothetical protein n=1 Tax=Ferrimicrobium sp. TaxID=2926050 RepID=UPI00260E5FCB|nr:hypothetical protein [Ferrimicrobium sp.]
MIQPLGDNIGGCSFGVVFDSGLDFVHELTECTFGFPLATVDDFRHLPAFAGRWIRARIGADTTGSRPELSERTLGDGGLGILMMQNQNSHQFLGPYPL